MTTASAINNGTKEAFKRAALYQSCKQSSILSNIDFENTATDALVDLVNHYNSQSIRELPIILSKMVVKGALTFVTNKYPKARSYINPENIRVRVEDDEMAHLISTSTKRSTNLVTLVVKNLAVSTLGSSIEQIRRELLDTQASNNVSSAAKITVEADIPEEMNVIEPPTVYSNFGSPVDNVERQSSEERQRDCDDNEATPTEQEGVIEECEKKSPLPPPTLEDDNEDTEHEIRKREYCETEGEEKEETQKSPKRIRLDNDDDGKPEQIDLISDEDELDDDVDTEMEEEDKDDFQMLMTKDKCAVKSNADDDDDDKIPLPSPPQPPSSSTLTAPTASKPKITDISIIRPSEMKNDFDFFSLVRSEMPNTKRLMTMSNKYQFDNDD